MGTKEKCSTRGGPSPSGAEASPNAELQNSTDEDPMRAAWWWIDRWRKSTAYICMSLEEQGLYRNLLDALWLFDDHAIPDTPKALITASGGDPEAWARSGPNVLKWMQRNEHGWTNRTAVEVIEKTISIHEARSKAGSLGAAKREANRQANAPSKDNPPSPSPSPSPSKTQRPRKRSSGTAVAVLGHNWSKDACDDWIERFGGTAPGGRIGKALKPLIAKYGWELIRPVWQKYLREEKPEFANPQDFASKLGRWLQKRVPKTKGEHFVEKTREVLKAFLEKPSWRRRRRSRGAWPLSR